VRHEFGQRQSEIVIGDLGENRPRYVLVCVNSTWR